MARTSSTVSTPAWSKLHLDGELRRLVARIQIVEDEFKLAPADALSQRDRA